METGTQGATTASDARVQPSSPAECSQQGCDDRGAGVTPVGPGILRGGKQAP